jgi:hypothetical protein
MTWRRTSDAQQVDKLLCSAEAASWPDSGPPVIAVAALGTLLTSAAWVAAMWLFVVRGLR